ncbi:MAG: DUF1648 domain-containing protein [Gemmatimonadales bacterium]|nr:MAG: DUF1648 domain-containing protein [Gemmatimonadales bacterium]
MAIVHQPTFRLNSLLFLAFIALAIYLGMTLPDRYPVHFGLSGEPTRWEERGPGMWILLVAVGAFSFGKLHLFQRFLLTDPDSTLLNVPHRDLFLNLPRERKIPVFRRMNRMLGILNTALLATYIGLLLLTWWSAHQPGGWPARFSFQALVAAVGFAVIFPLVELRVFSRMIRRKLREEGLLPPGDTPGAAPAGAPPTGAVRPDREE